MPTDGPKCPFFPRTPVSFPHIREAESQLLWNWIRSRPLVQRPVLHTSSSRLQPAGRSSLIAVIFIITIAGWVPSENQTGLCRRGSLLSPVPGSPHHCQQRPWQMKLIGEPAAVSALLAPRHYWVAAVISHERERAAWGGFHLLCETTDPFEFVLGRSRGWAKLP